MLDLPLHHLLRRADANASAPWLLVLLHGVGSHERDLFGLAGHVPANFHVLSLRAPNTVGPGAYAWFQFSVTPTGRVIHTVQESASRAQLALTLSQAAQQLGVPASRVVVGGFSQGGIMALSLLLTQPDLMHAALVMHSRLLDEVRADFAPPAELAGKQLWVSHGTADTVMPLASAHAIRAAVEALPLTLHYAEFPSRHEISADEWDQGMQWLGDLAV